MSKKSIIILEGVDRSGKDSLLNEIDRQTRYRYMTMDRGPVGFKAYCEIFNKPHELFEQYERTEKMIENNKEEFIMIYLNCSTEELIKRCLHTHHEIIDFDRHKAIYEKFFFESKIDKVVVDTTSTPAREIVATLIEKGIL